MDIFNFDFHSSIVASVGFFVYTRLKKKKNLPISREFTSLKSSWKVVEEDVGKSFFILRYVIHPAIKVGSPYTRIFNPIHNRSVFVLGRHRWFPTMSRYDSKKQFPKLSPSSSSSLRNKKKSYPTITCNVVTGLRIASVCFSSMIINRIIQIARG